MSDLDSLIISAAIRHRGIREVTEISWTSTSNGLSPVYQFSSLTVPQARNQLNELLATYLKIHGKEFVFPRHF